MGLCFEPIADFQAPTSAAVPKEPAPESPSTERQALLDIIGRDSSIAGAFTQTEPYCSQNGAGKSWREVEAKVLAELQRRHIREVERCGRGWLFDLVTLANDFKKAVHKAVIESANVAEIAGALAVRCRH